MTFFYNELEGPYHQPICHKLKHQQCCRAKDLIPRRRIFFKIRLRSTRVVPMSDPHLIAKYALCHDPYCNENAHNSAEQHVKLDRFLPPLPWCEQKLHCPKVKNKLDTWEALLINTLAHM